MVKSSGHLLLSHFMGWVRVYLLWFWSEGQKIQVMVKKRRIPSSKYENKGIYFSDWRLTPLD